MEPIPFLDLKRQYSNIKEEVLSAVQEVFSATAFSGGPFVEKFENDFSRYCNVSYAAAVNSGTSALHLALLAAGIKKGDEVIVQANTFIATAWAVSYVGATPVFVDCLPDTYQIDPAKVLSAITERTKAIIGVHLYGQAFEVDEIKSIALVNNLLFIEDCAQAHGAIYNGSKVGSFGDLSCFSFYPGKNLGAYGEGGAVLSNNNSYIDRIKKLRAHASSDKYHHEELGFNMRMEGVQAAILSVKLKYLDNWNNRRRVIAKKYLNGIKNSLISISKYNVDSVFHLFVVKCEERNKLIQHLNQNQIFPGIHYPVPCHLQKAYAHLNYKKGDLPNCELLSEQCLSLPMFAELKDEEIEYIIHVINQFH
ncbi:MAG: DegT/DnrJ/EryC1/StrS family aminotransferase [Cytophagaceae bacterium]